MQKTLVDSDKTALSYVRKYAKAQLCKQLSTIGSKSKSMTSNIVKYFVLEISRSLQTDFNASASKWPLISQKTSIPTTHHYILYMTIATVHIKFENILYTHLALLLTSQRSRLPYIEYLNRLYTYGICKLYLVLLSPFPICQIFLL